MMTEEKMINEILIAIVTNNRSFVTDDPIGDEIAAVVQTNTLDWGDKIAYNRKGKTYSFYKRDLEHEEKQIVHIPTDGHPIGNFAEELGFFFSNKKILFYRPTERQVVQVGMHAVGIDENKKVLVFQVVKNTEFITLIERYLEIGVDRRNSTTGTTFFVKKSISAGTAEVVLVSEHQFRGHLPVIERIFNIPMPFIKSGKLIFPKRGYDDALKSWLPEDAPTLDEKMTLDEGKAILEKLFKEFCFKSVQDRDNAIALLITPFVRGLYSSSTARTPIGFYKANRERAGKDYCAGITGVIYEGSAIQDAPIVDENERANDEELRKKLLSTFKSGRNRIHSSNNKGYLNSAILESVATAEYWEDRQLGSNSNLRFPNTLDISVSANVGITYTPDLSARCIFVNLFFAEEDPNQREFENPNLHVWVEQHKEEVVNAMYALVRDWVAKGQKPGSRSFSSYPEWARVVGGIMENAGYLSPCNPNDDLIGIGGDNETRDMKRLFELCYQTWGNKWILKKQVVEAIENQNSEFSGLFTYLKWDTENAKATAKFAIMLGKFVNRQFSGIVLECVKMSNTTRNEYRWSKISENKQKQDISQGNLVGVVGVVANLTSNHIEEEEIITLAGTPTSVTTPTKQPDKLFDIYGTIMKYLESGTQSEARLLYDLELRGYERAHIELELERMEHEGTIFKPTPDTIKIAKSDEI